MSETRTRRDPATIIAETEAKLAKAKAKQAIDAQASNPVVMEISEKLDFYNKVRTDANKGYTGNPSQRFQVRKESHSIWIKEIEAEQALADAEIMLADSIRPMISELRTKIATMLANGTSQEDCTTCFHDGYDAILGSHSNSLATIRELENALATTKEARVTYIEGKKANKVTASVPATEQASATA